MSNYVEKTLVKDEEVIYTGHLSFWSLTSLIFFGFIGLCLSFATSIGLVGLVLWIIAFGRYKTTELAFTNKRVIAKFGIISQNAIELNIKKVESIQVSQGILGRIFNYGDLIISGVGVSQVPIPGISNPMAFRRAFMEYSTNE